jgi:hypothetical protein
MVQEGLDKINYFYFSLPIPNPSEKGIFYTFLLLPFTLLPFTFKRIPVDVFYAPESDSRISVESR